MSASYPWDLSHFPGYTTASLVSVEDASTLDPERFWKEYVLRNRPCLIRGAISSWPAMRNWLDLDYLITTLGNEEVYLSCEPKIESFGLRSQELDSMARTMTRQKMIGPRRFDEVFPEIHAGGDGVAFVEVTSDKETHRLLNTDLQAPQGRFSFLPNPPRPRFVYPIWSAMFYKNSYSDWHFHPGTEAVMCQVIGTKRVALLPPNSKEWRQMVPVHVEQWAVYSVDNGRFPDFSDLRPLRANVGPGDGLYIPVNWWHAVQACPQEFGVTVPTFFDSPYRDLRQPATRHYLRALWKHHKIPAAALFVQAALSTVSAAIHVQ